MVQQPVIPSQLDSTVIDSLLGINPATTDIDLSTTLEINNPNLPPSDWVTPTGDSTLVIESFDYPRYLNNYPKIWEGRSGLFHRKTKEADVYYRIQIEDDNYYLTAQTEGKAVNFVREAKVNLRLYQRMRFRWRVHSLPENADETDSDKNDSAAAVRIIIGTNKFSAKAIKYVWSTTLPQYTEIDNGRLQVIVLESGPEKQGEWVWEEVNVYEHYRRLFGGDPRPMEVLNLLTDSDNTKTPVKADYDDITFIIPRPAVEMVPDFMLENPE